MESKIVQLIAQDRVYIPVSSWDGKLKRSKEKAAKEIADELQGEDFEGERVYARIEADDKDRARTMRQAVDEFKAEFPKYGEILEGKIAEKRVVRETHLYFGVNEGRRLSADDYMGVMTSLGITEATARSLYPDLMEVSRRLQQKREEERSILVGKTVNGQD